jgi:hypothetical protein
MDDGMSVHISDAAAAASLAVAAASNSNQVHSLSLPVPAVVAEVAKANEETKTVNRLDVYKAIGVGGAVGVLAGLLEHEWVSSKCDVTSITLWICPAAELWLPTIGPSLGCVLLRTGGCPPRSCNEPAVRLRVRNNNWRMVQGTCICFSTPAAVALTASAVAAATPNASPSARVLPSCSLSLNAPVTQLPCSRPEYRMHQLTKQPSCMCNSATCQMYSPWLLLLLLLLSLLLLLLLLLSLLLLLLLLLLLQVCGHPGGGAGGPEQGWCGTADGGVLVDHPQHCRTASRAGVLTH